MKDNHKPGPWEADGEEVSRNHIIITFVSGKGTSVETDIANAHLIASAVNSYDKNCGDRAVECAEGDLLGECLDILSLIIKSEFEGVIHISSNNLLSDGLRNILAKRKGE